MTRTARIAPALTAWALIRSVFTVRDGEARWRATGSRLGSLCVVRHATGRRCPGCGMTRATVLLAYGRPVRAARMNPLWVGVVIGLGAWWWVYPSHRCTLTDG